jgi:hypothetical protein
VGRLWHSAVAYTTLRYLQQVRPDFRADLAAILAGPPTDWVRVARAIGGLVAGPVAGRMVLVVVDGGLAFLYVRIT